MTNRNKTVIIQIEKEREENKMMMKLNPVNELEKIVVKMVDPSMD